MHTNNGSSTHAVPKFKPFPWRCGTCGEKTVRPAIVSYTETPVFEGRKYTLSFADMDAAKCAICGTVVLPSACHERITDALIKAAGLLEPREIREKLNEFGLTADGLAEVLGTKKELVEYWMKGHMIQPKSIDNLMRLYFELPEARTILNERSNHTEPAAPVLEVALADAH